MNTQQQTTIPTAQEIRARFPHLTSRAAILAEQAAACVVQRNRALFIALMYNPFRDLDARDVVQVIAELFPDAEQTINH